MENKRNVITVILTMWHLFCFYSCYREYSKKEIEQKLSLNEWTDVIIKYM